MSQRDDARNHLEKARKLIEQLISERDCARRQVEELRRLTEQQAPVLMVLGFAGALVVTLRFVWVKVCRSGLPLL